MHTYYLRNRPEDSALQNLGGCSEGSRSVLDREAAVGVAKPARN